MAQIGNTNNLKWDRKNGLEAVLNLIYAHDLVYVSDVLAYAPFGYTTYYRLFPSGSIEEELIKAALNKNKVDIKLAIRAKLFKSNKAAELIPLYRLMATREELDKLSHTSSESKVTVKNELEEMSLEELDAEIERLENQKLEFNPTDLE
jgi:hypothetical protein